MPTSLATKPALPSQTPREWLHEIIGDRCILTADDGWLCSSTGGYYAWLIDLRHAFLDAKALNVISELFWDEHEKYMPFQIGGLEMSAVPLVTAIQMKAHERGFEVNGFIVRKERKPSGVGKLLEGRVGPESIIAVDDIFNTAATMEKVRVTLDAMGRRIDRAFVVVEYHNARGTAWLDQHKFPVSSIFSLSDFGLVDKSSPKPLLRQFDVVWNFRSPGANHFHVTPKSAPATANGKVFFGSDRGTFWACHTATGEVDWTFQIAHPGRKGIWSRPLVVGDRVYFGGYDGNLYCLDAGDGREVWRNTDADWIGSSPIASPADGLLWIGLERERPSSRGAIAAFDLFTGAKVWEVGLPEYVHGTPSFSATLGLVAIGGNDGCLHLFDARRGTHRWSFPAGGEIKEAPCFDERRNVIYLSAFDGLVRAVDIGSGQQVWALSTSNYLYSSPLLHDDRLLISGTDKFLHVVDLNANDTRSISLGSKSVSTPVLLDGSIFLGTNGGLVLEIDADAMKISGSLQLPDPVTNRIARCEETGLFFALTYMNELFAFKRGDCRDSKPRA